jgi:hypothetical protein
MTFLYLCRTDGDQYRMVKMTSLSEVESSYLCSETHCECPAGVRPTCRHREMLPRFIQRNAINTGWGFDYDRGGWVQTEYGSTDEPISDPYSHLHLSDGKYKGQHLNTPIYEVENIQEPALAVELVDTTVSKTVTPAGSSPAEGTKPKALFIRRRI